MKIDMTTTKEDIRSSFYFVKNSPMSFGNGWNDLIYNLCSEIETYLSEHVELREGFIVVDMKEKYGTLRFYVYGADNIILDIIDKYEEMSDNVCEECGDIGMLRWDRGWYVALCDKHNDEWMSERNKNYGVQVHKEQE